jgi:Domain of unknown function (DUF4417)
MQDESVIGCLDPKKQQEFYDSLNDLYIPPQKANQDNLILPPYIPLITDAVPIIPDYNSDPIYAISMATLLKKGGDLCATSPQLLRKKLGLSANARVALTGSVNDEKLEQFWSISEEKDVWYRIAELNFEFVTSCTFSVWYNHPHFDQIFNQDKNLLTHDFIASYGVPSIPFIMFSNDERDYRENVSWLKERRDVTIVAMRSQFRRRSYEFIDLLDDMRALLDDVQRPLHFLIAGCSEPNRIASILNEFDATIVDGHAFMAGSHGERILQNLRDIKDLEPDKAELVLNNIQQYEQYCERVSCAKKGLLFRL